MKAMIKNMIEMHFGISMEIDHSGIQIQAGSIIVNDEIYKYIKIIDKEGEILIDISVPAEFLSPAMIDKAVQIIEA